MKHIALILFCALTASAQFGGARRVTPQGATLPSTCSTGDLFQKTGTGAGLYNCYSKDHWASTGITSLGAVPYAITFAGDTTKTVTAVTHGLGTTPGILWCRRSSDGALTGGWAALVNGSGDITINPASGSAYTGSCLAFSGNGATGPTGATGATGAAGAAATIAVGTVATGAAGSSATVVNGGSSSAAVFNFSIPKGDTGATGPAGPTGPAGAANVIGTMTSATTLTVNHTCGVNAVIAAFYVTGGEKIGPATEGLTDTNNYYATFSPAVTGTYIVNCSGAGGGGGGSMVYPAAGVAKSTGSGWDTPYAVGVSANNLVQLTADAKLPVVDGSLLTNLPGGGTIYTSNGITGAGTVGDKIRPDPSGGLAQQALYSASLSSWGTLSGGCVEKSITATGVTAGSQLAYGFPATLPAAVWGMMYPATDAVVVKLCGTGSPADGMTFSARVIGGF